MKPIVKKRMTALFIYPFSLLSAFGARILCLHVLGALFKAWNLTETTLPYAPLWAQRLTLISGEIADGCFLVFLLAPLVVYAGRASGGKRKTLFLYPLAGACLSILTVGAFLLFGSARMPKIRTFPFAGASFLYAFMDLCAVTACAYVCRSTPYKMFPRKTHLRLVVSVALQVVCMIVSRSSLSPVFIINACLSGLILFVLFERNGSVVNEILLLFSFRFFSRFVFGYPDLGGAYPVSEPLLTGAMSGVSHSLLLTLYLSVVCVLIAVRLFRQRPILKGDRHVSA